MTVRRIEALDPDGGVELGSAITLLDQVAQEAGPQLFTYGPQALPPALYRFEIAARSLLDDHVETEQGDVEVIYRVHDRAPVGHTLVRGVDLFDGHLVVAREDFAFPGRGPNLAFSRAWSSHHGNQPGPLGVGWSHTWDSRVILTPYGEAIVIGAEGGGMRFVPEPGPPPGWRPLFGYHGTLVSRFDDFGFDFFSRDGTRYHYRNAGGSEFPLGFVEDVNGNRVTLTYTGGGAEARLAQVRDDGGRALTFAWQQRTFAFWGGWVITRVDSPGGLFLELEYDAHGNLARARRGGAPPNTLGAHVERYRYGTGGVEGRHLLVAVRNELDGAETRYRWGSAGVGVQGDVVVPGFVVEELTEAEGGVTGFAYDRLALEQRAAGGELACVVTDGRGETTAYALNGYGSPLRITDPVGETTSQEWSPDDVLLISRTDANGATTRFEYDEHGNLVADEITVADYDGTSHVYRRETSYYPPSTFEPGNGGVVKERPSRRIDRDGRRTDFEYDSRGNLLREVVRVTDVDGQAGDVVTAHSYHANGDRASTTDARGHRTSFGYDGVGNLERVTNALGGSRFEYRDARGLPLARTDEEGRTTRFEHDALGRPLRTEHPDGSEDVSSYDDTTNIRTQNDAEGRVTVTRLDRQGRIVEITNAAGATKLYEYDAEGAKTLETSWFDATTPRLDIRFAYDAAGRVVRRVEPLGRVTSYRYDGVGNVLEEVVSDEDVTNGAFEPRVTLREYDELNRVNTSSRLLEPGSSGGVATVSTRYDGEGHEIEQIDALGRVRRARYDELGRPIQREEPAWRSGESKMTELLYDGTGNLVEERRPNERLLPSGEWEEADQVRRFEYDALGRLVQRVDAEGHVSTVQYDRVGNPTAEIDSRLERTEHRHDARNRRIETIEFLTHTTQPQRTVSRRWDYDRVGNVVEETHANGNVVTHEYDELDRRTRTRDVLGDVSEVSYDARGNRVREVDARGNTTVQVFDELDRMVESRRPEDRKERFSYDVAGNRVSAEDALGRETRFEYDRLDRLVATILPPVGTGLGGTGPEAELRETFSYDLAGNRLASTDARGHTTTFEYDALDRLVRQVAPAPLLHETRFHYDATGNLCGRGSTGPPRSSTPSST